MRSLFNLLFVSISAFTAPTNLTVAPSSKADPDGEFINAK